MTAPAQRSLLPSHRVIMVVVLLVGLAVSVMAYRAGVSDERKMAEAEFDRRAALRHALTSEILGHYEDALFGLSGLFTLDSLMTEEEFVRAASRLDGRIGGVQAIEWAPWIRHAQRASIETAQRRLATRKNFEFVQMEAGKPRRADDRDAYVPILFVHPLRSNEIVLGYDLLTAPTQPYLERARQSGQTVVSHQIRLAQETGTESGIVMIMPVYWTAGSPRTVPAEDREDAFRGYLQCVFRVGDLLGTVYRRPPDTILEALFIDEAEKDPARRILYYGTSPAAAGRPAPSEEEFRRGLSRELKIPFGQRDWRILFRPQPGWLESQATATPLLRSCSLMLLAGLAAGLFHLIARRTATVRAQVEDRTKELAESRRQLAAMLHALPGMSYRCSYDGQLTVLFVSDGARELTGWTAEEFLSGAVHFRDCIHPDDLVRVRDATRRALDERTDVEVEYRMRTRSGGEKWVLSRGRGVYTESGALNVFEGLAIDITKQKQAESVRLELERKLLEGQKLESLGLLAGGIAHDFNNLLSSILGNASMARLTMKPDAAVDDQMRAIESASLRAAELCRQMLAYAGKGRFVIEPTDLTLLVEELLPLLKISIAHQAALKLNLARNLPAVLADATQIRQIVMNLVLNAADAVLDRAGEIVLATGVVQLDQATLAACAAGEQLPPGEYVFLEVRDDGTGMTPEVVAKIFDPFFTTKFAGRGLGLAAVLGIVRGHKGALHVESKPGTGSSFRLFLPPLQVTPPVVKSVEIGSEQPWNKTGHILVIDDEQQVREVMVAMLKVCGFSATPAADGESGLAIFRERPEDFDVVVVDLLMPGLSGEQTLQALREIRADVRVLIVSGYSEGDILGRLGGGRQLGFLAKPFTRATLERRLRELLA